MINMKWIFIMKFQCAYYIFRPVLEDSSTCAMKNFIRREFTAAEISRLAISSSSTHLTSCDLCTKLIT